MVSDIKKGSLWRRLGWPVSAPQNAVPFASTHPGVLANDMMIAMVVLLGIAHGPTLVTAWHLGVSEGFFVAITLLLGITRELAVPIIVALFVSVVGWLVRRRTTTFSQWMDWSSFALIPYWIVWMLGSVVALMIGTPPGWMIYFLGLVVFAITILRMRVFFRTPTFRAENRSQWFLFFSLAALVVQIVLLVRAGDQYRPIQTERQLPSLAFPVVQEDGALGPVSPVTGGPQVIEFWATWCGPCLRSLSSVAAVQQRHPGVHYRFVNLDDPRKARRIVDDKRLSGTLLFAEQEKVSRLGISSLPHTVFVGADGNVIRIQRGGFSAGWLESQLRRLKN